MTLTPAFVEVLRTAYWLWRAQEAARELCEAYVRWGKRDV